jgi:hypothetical protein
MWWLGAIEVVFVVLIVLLIWRGELARVVGGMWRGEPNPSGAAEALYPNSWYGRLGRVILLAVGLLLVLPLIALLGALGVPGIDSAVGPAALVLLLVLVLCGWSIVLLRRPRLLIPPRWR